MPRILANFPRLITKTRKWPVAAVAALFLTLGWATAARAQQAAPPRYDPRQTEQKIENLEAGQNRSKPSVRLPGLAKPEVRASTKPLFKLQAVSVEGASAISKEALAETYKPFLGK